MLKVLSPLFVLLILCCISCDKEDDEAIVTPEISYVNYEVDFFRDHPDWHYLAPTFESVTEQTLVRPSYLEGAILQLITETVLVKEAYQVYHIQDSVRFSVVQDAENLIATEIACYEFWETDDLILLDIPAEYKTLYRQVVIQEGSGAEIPAEYSSVTKRILKTPATLLPREGTRAYQRVTFRIPDTLLIESFIPQQIPAGLGCVAGRGYRIN